MNAADNLKLAGRAQPTVGVVFTTYNRPHDLARVSRRTSYGLDILAPRR